MNYAEAAKKLFFQLNESERETVSTTWLLLANFIDKIHPGKLDVDNCVFTFEGKQIYGMSDLVGGLNAPGVLFREPKYEKTPGVVQVKNPPKVFLAPFSLKDITPDHVSGEAATFSKELAGLWEKAFGFGPLNTMSTRTAVDVALKNGFFPQPVNEKVYRNVYGTLPLDFQTPKLTSEAQAQQYVNVCSAFTEAFTQFTRNQYVLAAQETAASAANAAFWDSVYTSVEAVRDAPFDAASGLFGAFWDGIGWKWKAVLIAGAIGAAGYYSFPLWGSKVGKLIK